MPTKKRPYVPKVKGPQCRKCLSRGLQCVGLGWDIALGDDASPPSVQNEANSIGQGNLGSRSCFATQTRDQNNVKLHHRIPASESSEVLDLNHVVRGDIAVEPMSTNDDLFLFVDHRLLQPVSDPISLLNRQLCSHFSTRIAFEMVAIDDKQNGWRHLVLPFAHSDDLVMSAVLAVASFHNHILNSPHIFLQAQSLASISNGELLEYFPSHLQMHDYKVLSGLRQRSDLARCDVKARQSVLMTILVLQVGAMVTGRGDFPLLYRMLESAFEAVGGETGLGGGEVADFILSQVYKFRFYGATLLDEKAALQAISSPSNAGRLLNSLSSRWLDQPEHGQTLLLVNDLVRQAIDFYVEQADSSPSSASISSFNPREQDWPSLEESQRHVRANNSVLRIQHFVETLDTLLRDPRRDAGYRNTYPFLNTSFQDITHGVASSMLW
ncbi:hypothetical protein HJFPF1_13124 [Paramyrothecium foliicola]|nr:hypothetical protein HJFPF1_13124 [Paramyrothecium foliicola]